MARRHDVCCECILKRHFIQILFRFYKGFDRVPGNRSDRQRHA